METREYDDLNRLVSLENKVGDTVISGYRYELNAAGHRLSVTEASGRQVGYTYDELYRLTEENINNGQRTISYTYDNVGNRLTRTDSAEGVSAYTYDDNDRLLTETLTKDGATIDSIVYRYDDNGNMVERTKNNSETTTYVWNDDNRLVRAEMPNGDVAEYVYDDEGIRVSSTVNGETTSFLLDKNRPYAQVLEEFTSDALVAYYVYGHDLISQERGEETSFYQVDGLGSTRVLTDELGVVTDSYDYDAFGNLIESSGETENSYQYAGEQFDKVQDNYYLRQRFYNANAGRFLRRDTYEGRLRDPISLHKHIYAGANPTNFIDPSGLSFTLSSQQAVFEIVGILAAISYQSLSIVTGARSEPLGGFGDGLQPDIPNNTGHSSILSKVLSLRRLGGFGEGGELSIPMVTGFPLDIGDLVQHVFAMDEVAYDIAYGHAWNDHRIDWVNLGLNTQQELAEHIENVITFSTESKSLDGDRRAYWDSTSGTVVIENPSDSDGGTAFRPTRGKQYYDDL